MVKEGILGHRKEPLALDPEGTETQGESAADREAEETWTRKAGRSQRRLSL